MILKWQEGIYNAMNITSSAAIQMHCPLDIFNISIILKGILSFKILFHCPHYSVVVRRWEHYHQYHFLIPCPWIRAIRTQHNRVFSRESKWEAVVNAISFLSAGYSSCLSHLFSQGNTVLPIVIISKNQIIWIQNTSAQNWRLPANFVACLEENITEHHSFIWLPVWCCKFRKQEGFRCYTLTCISAPKSLFYPHTYHT